MTDSDDNEDIPFNKNFPLKPGVAEEVVQDVRWMLCDNPSPFTFTGTMSYIVGRGKVAIIDPGPDDEAHAKALLDANPERIIWGTDWPHVMMKGAMPNDGDLADVIADWVPDARMRELVLVHNPARLYGF